MVYLCTLSAGRMWNRIWNTATAMARWAVHTCNPSPKRGHPELTVQPRLAADFLPQPPEGRDDRRAPPRLAQSCALQPGGDPSGSWHRTPTALGPWWCHFSFPCSALGTGVPGKAPRDSDPCWPEPVSQRESWPRGRGWSLDRALGCTRRSGLLRGLRQENH